ncbi:MAG: ABC transporter ATP-binding protein [Clostridia bacterium]|nr:ABC transporter ATP-binding protein [Clostridia bacterium]
MAKEKEPKVKTEKKGKKEKKKKLPFQRTVSNNLFSLKMIWLASPLYLIIYLGSSVTYGILDFLTTGHLLRKIVNGVESGGSISGIITYVAILGVICVIYYLSMNYYWNVISQKLWPRITSSMNKLLFKKSAEVELACYENPEFYDRYVKAMDEATNRLYKVLNTVDNLVMKFVSLSANSILIFIIDPWLILFGVFPFLLGFFKRLDNIANHKMASEHKPSQRRANYVKRTFYLNDYAKEMRIGGMYVSMLRDLKDAYTEYKRIARKYGIRRAIYQYIQRIGLEVVTILGAMLYSVWSTLYVGSANGGMSIGDCIVVLGAIGGISHSLNGLIQNFAEFGEHALFLEDVRFFLDYQPTIVDGDRTASGEGGDIEVKGVSFRYDGSDKDTLTDIDFVWHKGERIALVGVNGSGKTTLVKLLLRLYDPTEGEISMDSTNIKDFTLSSYRDGFSTVFQDYKMFSLSVKDNVLLRPEREGDRELVENALKESGAYERVSKLENGIDNILTREFDDNGANLSGGEQQKLLLARVFADPTPFVLLDEPSSALDPNAEYKMFENMMRATEGRSVMFISHRLSSAVLADRVILMDNGRIAEMGTHAELMEKDGRYAEMFRRQAENYLGSEVSASE